MPKLSICDTETVFLNSEEPSTSKYKSKSFTSPKRRSRIRTRRHDQHAKENQFNSSDISAPSSPLNTSLFESAQVIPQPHCFSFVHPLNIDSSLSPPIQSLPFSPIINIAADDDNTLSPPREHLSTSPIPSSKITENGPSLLIINNLSSRFMERMISLPLTSVRDVSDQPPGVHLIGGRFVRLSDVGDVLAPQLHPSLCEAVLKWALPILLPPPGRVVEGDVAGLGRVQLVPLNSLLEALPLLIDCLKLTL